MYRYNITITSHVINRDDHPSSYKPPKRFNKGDIFGLTVDFKKDTLTLYHNYKFVQTISMKGHKIITSACSIYHPGVNWK